ncbi:MAG TPA: glycosyltransferase [Parafilimonas sp.]|nr:glycosyltransferase [Parafilimonas sp.]
MKILIIHNYYLQAGGEDVVFAQESSLLSKDHIVKKLPFYNKSGIYGAIQFFTSIWNLKAAWNLKKIIAEFQPQLIHIHNCHFACGPLIIRIARKKKVPVILTLHNYRLLCPSTYLMLNGRLFTVSLHQNFPWTAVKNKAYRNSVIQTFWLGLVVWFHRIVGTWKMVNKFITLTEFEKNIFQHSKLHLNKNQLVVKYNFLKDPELTPQNRNNNFLFVGRLSREKGIHLLLHAFSKSGLPIIIAGDGPLKNEVEAISSTHNNVRYAGRLSGEDVKKLMQNSTALIFPSIWYEGMPMTIIEAFATGTPVIASNIGAMASMITHNFNGLHFNLEDADDLTKTVFMWQSLPQDAKNIFYKNARLTYEENYTPEDNLKQLVSIYEQVTTWY